MDTSSFDNAKHTLQQVEAMKKKALTQVNEWNKVFSALPKYARLQVGAIHTDISKMQNMMKSGNYDSDFIEQMKVKHANKGN